MEIVEARVSSRAKVHRRSPPPGQRTEYTQKAHESMNGKQGKCRKSNPIKSSKQGKTQNGQPHSGQESM